MVLPFYLPTCSVWEPQFSPHPRQHLVLSIFSILAKRVGVKENLFVVVVSVSCMTDDAEHLFVRLAIRISSLVMSITVFHLFFKLVCMLSYYWGIRFHCYSGYRVFIRYMIEHMRFFCFCFFFPYTRTTDCGKGRGWLKVIIINVWYLSVLCERTLGCVSYPDYLGHFLIF